MKMSNRKKFLLNDHCPVLQSFGRYPRIDKQTYNIRGRVRNRILLRDDGVDAVRCGGNIRHLSCCKNTRFEQSIQPPFANRYTRNEKRRYLQMSIRRRKTTI